MLKKGQSRGASSGGLFSAQKTDASGQTSTVQPMGFFKSIIEVENPEDYAAYLEKKTLITNKLKEQVN